MGQMIRGFIIGLCLVLISIIAIKPTQEDSDVIISKQYDNTIESLIVYELIDVYSEEYNIPRHIAFNIAFLETRYKGPFDWSYYGNKKSSVGALGVMQIMPSTARKIDNTVSKKDLLQNPNVNIQISMKLLRKLYDKYGDWEVVCGCYNTGKPMVNKYAKLCVVEDYKKNWTKIDHILYIVKK